MRRILAIAVACMALMIFTLAHPAAASNRYWATGENVQINLLDRCGQDFTYPANTPFWIAHGWREQPWSTDTPEDKRGFMVPTTYYEFRVDRVPQGSSMSVRDVPDEDSLLKLFISEYDQGMTGTHRFGSLWFLDGSLVGGNFGEAVFQGGCVSYVTFV